MKLGEIELNILKIAQIMLGSQGRASSVNPTLIEAQVRQLLILDPKYGTANVQLIVDELIRRFSVWIDPDVSLSSDEDHIPWLSNERKNDWKYWRRYREYIENEISLETGDKLDKSTDKILAKLEDPLRAGVWTRRGLVVGHVQSGKTASYTGLVCKAADAGYKVIIVLAGLHNNLRAQTQIRLEEGFLGYQTDANSDVLKLVGVGLLDSDQSMRPNCGTFRSDSGDFNQKAAQSFSITPEQRPWLFVVKKNKTVLSLLLRWIQSYVADSPFPRQEEIEIDDEDNDLPIVRKRVSQFPLLIIDDEADNASVDTGEMETDSNGKPDLEHQPTTINKLIRRLLHSFSRSAYVGYTATPFANIFIHEKGETYQEGPDLFPSAFIQTLSAPNNYVGPSVIFGSSSSLSGRERLPLVIKVDDYAVTDSKASSGWMPPKHKSGHYPTYSDTAALPPSLREAIRSFLIACAIRNLRGQKSNHSSMLVHVSRFTSVQGIVRRDVESYVDEIRNFFRYAEDDHIVLKEFEELWLNDFSVATRSMRELQPDDIPPNDPTWVEVRESLRDVINDVEVREINGTAGDVLDYSIARESGLRVIAIGGDKLARGLTLEGLCTSYFLRASRMYDTLMQMGRWFGYRPGYLDLCRLYTSADLIKWFEHISHAASELREEFEYMSAAGATPREFGLKVRSHPELMVTSQVKMRTARTLHLSYSGQMMQTVSFPAETDALANNICALNNLVETIGTPVETGVIERGWSPKAWHGHLWKNIDHQDVVEFLRSYETSALAHRVNSKVLATFIERMATKGELTSWSIALIGNSEESRTDAFITSNNLRVNKVKRSCNPDFTDRYAIGVLLDPSDEAIDLSESAWSSALSHTSGVRRKTNPSEKVQRSIPSGQSIRHIKSLRAESGDLYQQGLLILYVIDPQLSDVIPKGLADLPDIVAFGLSFPGSKLQETVEYKITNVAWESEYGKRN